MKAKIYLRSSIGNDPAKNFQKRFEKEVDLPFVPAPGIHLSPVVWLQFQVTHVVYDMTEGYFEVMAEQTAFDREGHDLDHIASAMITSGWVEA